MRKKLHLVRSCVLKRTVCGSLSVVRQPECCGMGGLSVVRRAARVLRGGGLCCAAAAYVVRQAASRGFILMALLPTASA